MEKKVKKKLIIINGTMGVGKTTTCRELYKALDRCVWLDGDWCWMMNPWMPTDENKAMVQDNITYILNNYLKNTSFDYIIFDWVIHLEEIFDLILDKLTDDFELYKITLVCSEDELKRRMLMDNRDEKVMNYSLERMKLYLPMDTIKVDTTNSSVTEVVKKIIDIIK
jgi:broad-specificity NMP kinase